MNALDLKFDTDYRVMTCDAGFKKWGHCSTLQFVT